ncbi:hypothetical protein M422DRAFT_246985 [Sphaerobolus stellatus SS14]|nr:hypothetical protein M422DRAFT_246985 [Sphaerobolus stellatus SS14]
MSGNDLIQVERPDRRRTDSSRPFGCSVCGKRFARKVDLETHARIHTNEQPFACSIPRCGSTFTSQSNLKRHEKTHGDSSIFTNEDAAGDTGPSNDCQDSRRA